MPDNISADAKEIYNDLNEWIEKNFKTQSVYQTHALAEVWEESIKAPWNQYTELTEKNAEITPSIQKIETILLLIRPYLTYLSSKQLRSREFQLVHEFTCAVQIAIARVARLQLSQERALRSGIFTNKKSNRQQELVADFFCKINMSENIPEIIKHYLFSLSQHALIDGHHLLSTTTQARVFFNACLIPLFDALQVLFLASNEEDLNRKVTQYIAKQHCLELQILQMKEQDIPQAMLEELRASTQAFVNSLINSFCITVPEDHATAISTYLERKTRCNDNLAIFFHTNRFDWEALCHRIFSKRYRKLTLDGRIVKARNPQDVLDIAICEFNTKNNILKLKKRKLSELKKIDQLIQSDTDHQQILTTIEIYYQFDCHILWHTPPALENFAGDYLIILSASENESFAFFFVELDSVNHLPTKTPIAIHNKKRFARILQEMGIETTLEKKIRLTERQIRQLKSVARAPQYVLANGKVSTTVFTAHSRPAEDMTSEHLAFDFYTQCDHIRHALHETETTIESLERHFLMQLWYNKPTSALIKEYILPEEMAIASLCLPHAVCLLRAECRAALCLIMHVSAPELHNGNSLHPDLVFLCTPEQPDEIFQHLRKQYTDAFLTIAEALYGANVIRGSATCDALIPLYRSDQEEATCKHHSGKASFYLNVEAYSNRIKNTLRPALLKADQVMRLHHLGTAISLDARRISDMGFASRDSREQLAKLYSTTVQTLIQEMVTHKQLTYIQMIQVTHLVSESSEPAASFTMGNLELIFLGENPLETQQANQVIGAVILSGSNAEIFGHLETESCTQENNDDDDSSVFQQLLFVNDTFTKFAFHAELEMPIRRELLQPTPVVDEECEKSALKDEEGMAAGVGGLEP